MRRRHWRLWTSGSENVFTYAPRTIQIQPSYHPSFNRGIFIHVNQYMRVSQSAPAPRRLYIMCVPSPDAGMIFVSTQFIVSGQKVQESGAHRYSSPRILFFALPWRRRGANQYMRVSQSAPAPRRLYIMCVPSPDAGMIFVSTQFIVSGQKVQESGAHRYSSPRILFFALPWRRRGARVRPSRWSPAR